MEIRLRRDRPRCRRHPVVLAGVDGPKRVLTISPPHQVGKDHTDFMNQVRAFYADKPGLDPEGKGPVRIARETKVS